MKAFRTVKLTYSFRVLPFIPLRVLSTADYLIRDNRFLLTNIHKKGHCNSKVLIG